MPLPYYNLRPMATIAEQLYKEILDELDKEAKRILNECVNERDYEHRTMNLYDSYGYGIYLKGILKREGFLSASPKAVVDNHGFFGRDEIESFLESGYSPDGGIDIVVAAAMPYATELEYGIGVRRKYRVITMSFQKLQTLAAKIGCGAVQQIVGSRKA